MFAKEVYTKRRQVLLSKMQESCPEGNRGIALFIGNVDAPAQYKDNCYNFRQDSTWLYYFGIDEPKFAAIIDLDSAEETIFANDFEIDDIIWMGPQDSIRSLADRVGVKNIARYEALNGVIAKAMSKGRRIHFTPISRYYNSIKIHQLTGYSFDELKKIGTGTGKHCSQELVEAIIDMRLVKEDCEIEALDYACHLGQEMHRTARRAIQLGILEQEIVGKMEGYSHSVGWGVSFSTILSQNGERLHNHCHSRIIESGNLLLIDAGTESNMHYASDFTRTYPTNGKFTAKQRDVYQIVCDCNEYAFSITKPGITYQQVHIEMAKKMLTGLKTLDIVRGDVDDMVKEGIAGLFMPHGLGHNMGLDVHDMEDFGEMLVGYDKGQVRPKQLGLGGLRMGRKLKEGYVITDEPGIYFIPALIDKWKAEGTDKGFVNYQKLEEYRDFGGIRLEDDILVLADGARRLGKNRLPIQPDDVEKAMSED